MGLIVLVALIVFGLLFFHAWKMQTEERGVSILEPNDYGNGVYYFGATGAKFAKSLSKFKADHPELKVTAIASDTFGKGHLCGYWVNFEERS